MDQKRIVVLLHEADCTFDSADYYLPLLMTEWQRMGFLVERVRGVSRFVPADFLVPHIDLTVIPDEYRRFMDRYPVALNRRVFDISKSLVSSNKLLKNDLYAGPVIVKTEANYGGIPERVMKKGEGGSDSLGRRAVRKLRSLWRGGNAICIDWKTVECIDTCDYPIFESLQETPAEIFANPRLIVEKFIPELDGEDYCLRSCLFCGDKVRGILLRSKNKVVKASNTHRREEVDVVPEIIDIKRRLGFDFGKFDYVHRDGKVVLFDANRTPSFFSLETGIRAAQHMAQGIWSLLQSAPHCGDSRS